MSGDDVNPAAVAQPVEDVQGDGRWMSQVGGVYSKCFLFMAFFIAINIRISLKIVLRLTVCIV